MRQLTFILSTLLSLFITSISNAQCIPDASMTVPGLKPATDSLPCIVQSVPYDATIYIKNFTSLAGFNIDSLIIDSVTNLPCGIFYIPNKTNASYASNEAGCINLYGKTSDPAGQYQLGLFVRVYATPNIPFLEGISTPLSTFATLIGQDYRYWVRVKSSSGTCFPVDTNSTSTANKISSCNVKNTKRPTLKVDTVSVYNVSENAGLIRFSYKITNPDTLPFSIRLKADSIGSTASPGTDFIVPNVVRTFPGTYSESITIINDMFVEPTETARVQIKSIAGPVLILDSIVQVQINNDDVFKITMNSAGYAIPEDSSSARFAVKLTAFYPTPTTVTVSKTSGDAIRGVDFAFNDTSLTLPANDTMLHFLNIGIFEDTEVEANEQAIFTLSNITNGAVPEVSAFNLVIIDNDTAGVGIHSPAKHSFVIYPNPFDEKIQIQANAAIQYVNISDINGKHIFTSTNEPDTLNPMHINTAMWSTGVYILQVRSYDGETQFYRLIK